MRAVAASSTVPTPSRTSSPKVRLAAATVSSAPGVVIVNSMQSIPPALSAWATAIVSPALSRRTMAMMRPASSRLRTTL